MNLFILITFRYILPLHSFISLEKSNTIINNFPPPRAELKRHLRGIFLRNGPYRPTWKPRSKPTRLLQRASLFPVNVTTIQHPLAGSCVQSNRHFRFLLPFAMIPSVVFFANIIKIPVSCKFYLLPLSRQMKRREMKNIRIRTTSVGTRGKRKCRNPGICRPSGGGRDHLRAFLPFCVAPEDEWKTSIAHVCKLLVPRLVRAVIKGHQANGCIESNVCRLCTRVYMYIYIYGGSTWTEERGRQVFFSFPFSLCNFWFWRRCVKWSWLNNKGCVVFFLLLLFLHYRYCTPTG